MGSKLAAKACMAAAGVPVLPGGDVTGLDPDAVGALAAEAGYPVLIKASAGGGGRGMCGSCASRRSSTTPWPAPSGSVGVRRRHGVRRAVRRAPLPRRGPGAGRPLRRDGSPVRARARSSAVTRRSSRSRPPRRRRRPAARIGKAAVTAAAEVGYVGAATVELILTPDGEFAFLEMNTRLQVEHPVTELVTGLDLVEWQLRVAAGEALGQEVTGATMRGHADGAQDVGVDPCARLPPRHRRAARVLGPGGRGRQGGLWRRGRLSRQPALRPDAGQGRRLGLGRRGCPPPGRRPRRGPDPLATTNCRFARVDPGPRRVPARPDRHRLPRPQQRAG